MVIFGLEYAMCLVDSQVADEYRRIFCHQYHSVSKQAWTLYVCYEPCRTSPAFHFGSVAAVAVYFITNKIVPVSKLTHYILVMKCMARRLYEKKYNFVKKGIAIP